MRARLRKISVVLILLLIAVPILAQDSYRCALIEINDIPRDKFDRLAPYGFEVVKQDLDLLQMVVPVNQLDVFDNLDIPYRTIHRDLTEYYVNRARQATAAIDYPFRSEIINHLDSLTVAHPDIVSQKFSLGTTEFFHYDIWCIKISDNPELDEDEPEVLYVSLIHAREVASGMALLHFMDHLVSNYGTDPEITDIIDNRELYFIPVQNPDGYEWNFATNPDGGGMWRKNLVFNGDGSQGVDLNRNFGFEWGYDNIGSSPYPPGDTYRGPSPFSEAETQATRDFIISRNFSIIHNIHSYSDLEIWPPGYRRIYSQREDFFSALGDSITQYNGYTPGISWTLYPTNGDADDWAWGDTISKPRIISLTAEIGGPNDGFWPPLDRLPELMEENIFPNLFLAKIADNPYGIGAPLAPVMHPPDLSGDLPALSWSHVDSANPVAGYRLIEYTDRSTVVDDAEDYYGYWETDRMRLSSLRAYSGTRSWHDEVGVRENHWLVSRTPYLVEAGDSLAFQIWYDIEYGSDYFYAQVSTDGGFTWTNLPGNLTTNDDPRGYHVVNGITGSSNEWSRAVYDLSDYTGQYVLFRLAYITDYYNHGAGIFIDDIENVDVYGFVDTLETALTDTTYVPDIPWGSEAAYRVSSIDIDNQESRLSRMVSVSALAYIVGDLNASGRIDVADLSYLVDFIFRGGPSPVPMAAGDVNCSDRVDVSDLSFLVDFIFRGGPTPSCP